MNKLITKKVVFVKLFIYLDFNLFISMYEMSKAALFKE